MKMPKTVDKMITEMEDQIVTEIRLGRRPVEPAFETRQCRITSCMSLSKALLVLTPAYEYSVADLITAVCGEFSE
jgi:hypothetical protein